MEDDEGTPRSAYDGAPRGSSSSSRRRNKDEVIRDWGGWTTATAVTIRMNGRGGTPLSSRGIVFTPGGGGPRWAHRGRHRNAA